MHNRNEIIHHNLHAWHLLYLNNKDSLNYRIEYKIIHQLGKDFGA
jgi:hypothetical protein